MTSINASQPAEPSAAHFVTRSVVQSTEHSVAASADQNPPLAKLLVVDDRPSNLVAMCALLADSGVDVLTASSGAEALELLLVNEVALALLDVQMPGMDGYTLAELMRGSERTRGVPIIFLTAGALEARASFRGYEAGAVDFLYKPLDERVLRSKVAVFVELHRQRRQIADHAAQLARLSEANALTLASLSHDLCEPLTVLALNAELLMHRSEASPALLQCATRLKSATGLLQRQVDHLVNLAKAPPVELSLCPQRTALAQLAHDRWHLSMDPVALVTDGAGGLADGVADRLEDCTAGGDSGGDATAAAGPGVSAFTADGDTVGHWDPVLLARALDQLLLQAQTHCGEAPLSVVVDGSPRNAVVFRIHFAPVLSAAAAHHLLGGSESQPGLPPTADGDGTGSQRGANGASSGHAIGDGLREPERIARAHGGSLIGSTRKREGTVFELMLPRAQASQAV